MVAFAVTRAAGLALIFAVTLPSAFAATSSQTGTIHFYGQIVEDPCVIAPESRNISVSCLQGNKMQTRQVSYADVLNHTTVVSERAAISMTWINPEKTLGIVQVDYR
ncbi:type 1 fimbrial protein [Enterobacteriaceae bacterium H4N4]|uniref:Type 1 fimbrial protein n=1 Tax=Silvania confinis TaxID=2926470 RepID=A0A9J6QJN0_9ENTR|nr:type 1 fimbrial protein [Silvania confinis]MCU6671036.1 type 1 fimbrial protein [Silvania confinis]